MPRLQLAKETRRRLTYGDTEPHLAMLAARVGACGYGRLCAGAHRDPYRFQPIASVGHR